MTSAEIKQTTIKVIASKSEFTEQEILALYSPPDTDPKLEKFISASRKAMLAGALKAKMKFIKQTELTNLLFTTITTLDQLIKKIISYNKPNNT